MRTARRLPRDCSGDPARAGAATRQFLVGLADTASRRWKEKDQRIWEVRSEPRRFVYSKLMCWVVALDRAIELADRLDSAHRVEPWEHTRAQIREGILNEGWSDQVNAFPSPSAPRIWTPPA